jgi:hypothetical protein
VRGPLGNLPPTTGRVMREREAIVGLRGFLRSSRFGRLCHVVTLRFRDSGVGRTPEPLQRLRVSLFPRASVDKSVSKSVKRETPENQKVDKTL